MGRVLQHIFIEATVANPRGQLKSPRAQDAGLRSEGRHDEAIIMCLANGRWSRRGQRLSLVGLELGPPENDSGNQTFDFQTAAIAHSGRGAIPSGLPFDSIMPSHAPRRSAVLADCVDSPQLGGPDRQVERLLTLGSL